eukprot:scaffold2249_cov272-Pinguiococcus_pyrenoidosus.AAC.5
MIPARALFSLVVHVLLDHVTDAVDEIVIGGMHFGGDTNYWLVIVSLAGKVVMQLLAPGVDLVGSPTLAHQRIDPGLPQGRKNAVVVDVVSIVILIFFCRIPPTANALFAHERGIREGVTALQFHDIKAPAIHAIVGALVPAILLEQAIRPAAGDPGEFGQSHPRIYGAANADHTPARDLQGST